MVDLAAGAQLEFFTSTKLPTRAPSEQAGGRAQAGERSHSAAVRHLGAIQNAVGLDADAVRHPRVAQPGALMERAAGADLGAAGERHSGVDDGVGADPHAGLDDRARRLEDGDAGLHQHLEVAVDEETMDGGELGAVVDAQRLGRIGERHQAHRDGLPPPRR